MTQEIQCSVLSIIATCLDEKSKDRVSILCYFTKILFFHHIYTEREHLPIKLLPEVKMSQTAYILVL